MKVVQESWVAVSKDVRRVVIEAASKRDTLNTINLGGRRTFITAEAALWASFGGVSFAAQVATVVSCEVTPSTKCQAQISSLFKGAKAIRFAASTPISINKFLASPVFGTRPGLVRKGTAAAAAEAAAAAAVAQAAAELEDLEKKASVYDAALRDDEGARDRARRAAPDDPLRQGMVARMRLGESQRRQDRYAEVLELGAAEVLSAVAAAEALALDELSGEWEAEVDEEIMELLAGELPEDELPGPSLAAVWPPPPPPRAGAGAGPSPAGVWPPPPPPPLRAGAGPSRRPTRRGGRAPATPRA